MQFTFDIRKLFPCEITCLKSDMPVFKNGRASNSYTEMAEVIDKLGEHSALAQHLPQIVTTFRKFRNSDQKLFVLSDLEENRVLGMLKTGRKRLFIHDKEGTCVETVPLCVLDFYVHESRQRKGCGKRLFDEMLMEECIVPCAVAIDSPSPKMLKFLQKHYGLRNPVFASNNYVIYPGFFENQSKISGFSREYSNQFNGGSQYVCNSYQSSASTHVIVERQKRELTDNQEINSDQQTYYMPHTRLQAMPTKMVVIKPKEQSQTETPTPRKLKQEDSVISYDTTNTRSSNSGHKNNLVQSPYKEQKQTKNKKAESQSSSNDKSIPKPEKKLHQEYKSSGAMTEGDKIKYSVLSSVELNAIRSLSACSRRRGTYTYVNAVRHHNGHTRLW